MEREVLPPRTFDLERAAILAAVFALAFWLTGCTPRQRKATLGIASTALLVADWQQTNVLVAHCNEQNPIIGTCGDTVRPGVYFPIVIVANLAAGYYLHESYLAGITGAQLVTVSQNYVYLTELATYR